MNRYRYGLEAEYMLGERGTFRPLWFDDLTFEQLNTLLESIDYVPLLEGLTLDGLELDPPHRKLMPYYVEGYAIANAELSTYVDVLPKGIEIRTPVCDDLSACLRVFNNLLEALQQRLAEENMCALGIGHHPTAADFSGPQNSKRHDWWQWANISATTYGPDLNLSPCGELKESFNWEDLQRRANYYGPALVAFALNSPFYGGAVWNYRGQPGLSVRTFRRSPVAPMLAWHPKEGGRVEFKAFDMPSDSADFRALFLMWLWLMHDVESPGRADDADRIYDLGQVARFGWQAELVMDRAHEALERARLILPSLAEDPAPVALLTARLQEQTSPAVKLIERAWGEGNLNSILEHYCVSAAGEERPRLIRLQHLKGKAG